MSLMRVSEPQSVDIQAADGGLACRRSLDGAKTSVAYWAEVKWLNILKSVSRKEEESLSTMPNGREEGKTDREGGRRWEGGRGTQEVIIGHVHAS